MIAREQRRTERRGKRHEPKRNVLQRGDNLSSHHADCAPQRQEMALLHAGNELMA